MITMVSCSNFLVNQVQKLDPKADENQILAAHKEIIECKDLPEYIKDLNECQMAALISFTMRKGIKATKTLCNKRTIDKVGDGILCYDKIESKINSKLAKRRQAERYMYYASDIDIYYAEQVPELDEFNMLAEQKLQNISEEPDKNGRIYSREVIEKSISTQRREAIQKEELDDIKEIKIEAKNKNWAETEVFDINIIPRNDKHEEYVNNYAPPMRRISMGRARNNEVKWLQTALNYCMGANLMIDGKFGYNTETAVKKFKLDNGLFDNNVVTGVVDRETRCVIIEACNNKNK